MKIRKIDLNAFLSSVILNTGICKLLVHFCPFLFITTQECDGLNLKHIPLLFTLPQKLHQTRPNLHRRVWIPIKDFSHSFPISQPLFQHLVQQQAITLLHTHRRYIPALLLQIFLDIFPYFFLLSFFVHRYICSESYFFLKMQKRVFVLHFEISPQQNKPQRGKRYFCNPEQQPISSPGVCFHYYTADILHTVSKTYFNYVGSVFKHLR